MISSRIPTLRAWVEHTHTHNTVGYIDIDTQFHDTQIRLAEAKSTLSSKHDSDKIGTYIFLPLLENQGRSFRLGTTVGYESDSALV